MESRLELRMEFPNHLIDSTHLGNSRRTRFAHWVFTVLVLEPRANVNAWNKKAMSKRDPLVMSK